MHPHLTNSGGGLYPVGLGAVLIYLGVWMAIQPAEAWHLAQDFMMGIQRFQGTLLGAPSWSSRRDSHSETPQNLTGLRAAGMVIAAIGVAVLAAGLSRLA
ncbi:hypothetical protein [uncultured Paludibaculum sp.]|uniref:hypothetical protein n=1 Tax=uncultured Paludibaculum sp. TaxID=1765020 RepID=UPI002AAC29A1|nr:hypothetical protein [uncultured Paludibaculum sp.]